MNKREPQRMTEIDAMARGTISAINNPDDAMSLSLAIKCISEETFTKGNNQGVRKRNRPNRPEGGIE